MTVETLASVTVTVVEAERQEDEASSVTFGAGATDNSVETSVVLVDRTTDSLVVVTNPVSVVEAVVAAGVYAHDSRDITEDRTVSLMASVLVLRVPSA